ncbi:hypothetical protein HOG48_05730 [Candidatus Peregrinibacteria bacterium]|jgi:hypothetical protein|nr:hypothetical protein [Candidatus Peregrinibacteria bacterium]
MPKNNENPPGPPDSLMDVYRQSIKKPDAAEVAPVTDPLKIMRLKRRRKMGQLFVASRRYRLLKMPGTVLKLDLFILGVSVLLVAIDYMKDKKLEGDWNTTLGILVFIAVLSGGMKWRFKEKVVEAREQLSVVERELVALNKERRSVLELEEVKQRGGAGVPSSDDRPIH